MSNHARLQPAEISTRRSQNRLPLRREMRNRTASQDNQNGVVRQVMLGGFTERAARFKHDQGAE